MENLNKKIISQIEINIETFTKDNLPDYLKSIPATKPGSRELK